MKNLILIVLLSSLVTSIGLSQQDEPPVPPKRSRAAKIGAFGGFTPGWLSLDVKPINDFLVGGKGAPFKDNGVFLFGGAGAAYVMFVPNLRIGGMGMGGSLKSVSLDATGLRRDAQLGVGFAGVTFEYVIPVVERFDVSVGVMLGGGGIDLTLRQDAGGASTWNQQWNYFGSTGTVSNNTRKLGGSFFAWIPSVNAEYALLGWVGLRLGVSYVGMSAPSWKIDDTYELLGVPSNINGQGVMINAGVFVGTF
jgi:hypothetical protein